MKNIQTSLLFFLLCVGYAVNAQFRETVEQQRQLLNRISQGPAVIEGYGEEIEGTTMSYTSVRDDCREALIARTTDGTMNISWKTAVIPQNYKSHEVTFFMPAGFDETDEGRSFYFFVNGVRRFEYTSDLSGNWEIKGAEGGTMQFTPFLTDTNQDVFGYLTITVPVSWIKPGTQAVFRVEGEKADDFTWLMIYKCTDAWRFFNIQAMGETWFDLQLSDKGKKQYIVMTAPLFMAQKAVTIEIDGQTGTGVLKKGKGKSTVSVKIKGLSGPASGKQLTVDVEGTGSCVFPEIYTDKKAAETSGDFLIEMSGRSVGNKWLLHVDYRYRPVFMNNLKELSESKMKNGEVHIINSSHQDIAWMDSPQQCIIDRDVLLVTPALNQLSEHPDYGHDLEDVLILREYLDRHPDRKDEIYKYSKEGRITWGAAYNAPYEEMYTGESLVRQFYLGKRWIENLFPGVEANTYWNVDVPGRTLQMPQILAKCGVPYMMISRHRRGVFHWQSPDGSSVVTYSSHHYGMSRNFLQGGFATAAQYISGLANEWKDYNTNSSAVAVIPVLSSSDMSPPDMYYDLIEKWNEFGNVSKNGEKSRSFELPKMLHSTASNFLDKMVLSTPDMRTIQGERPNVWAYIHGPSHHHALSAGREAGIWLPAAEKFAAIRTLIENDPATYPREDFINAWEAAIYPDHGWGGKNGDVTDSVFLHKMKYGENMAKKILNKSITGIARRIKTDDRKGYPLHIFNSLSWWRKGPVEAKLSFELGTIQGFVLTDANGRNVDMQIKDISTYNDGSVRTADVIFIAEKAPSMGYTTYYIKPIDIPVKIAGEESIPVQKIENGYYKVDLVAGGIRQLYDKSMEQEIFAVEKFLGAEWFTMHSFGNGAGEFADVQQPDMEGFDKMSNHQPQWEMIESGPVRTVVKFVEELEHLKVEVRLVVYNSIKRIDIETALLNWDGTPYREFRLAFPLNMKEAQVSYEVPFGVVRVGKDEVSGSAGERYITSCKDVRPRGIMNWIGASDENFGVTISSSVAVADYIDPTDEPVEGPVIQPILLASRHSCHWEGLQFSQEGDHYYRFSLTSHEPGWQKGNRFGIESNEPLQYVFNPDKADMILPEWKSFFSVDGKNVIVSALKMCEDDNNVIIRFYETEGISTNIRIHSNFKFSAAIKTDMLEREIEVLKVIPSGVDFTIGHHAIETIKLVK